MIDRRQVRVLHLIEDLGAGGAERLLYSNLSRLDRSRFHGAVCHLYDRALYWRNAIVDLGYPVHSLGLRSIRDVPRGVWRLRRWLAAHPVDVIHTHLFGANLVGRLAGHLCGVPVISSLHSPDYEPSILVDNPSLSPAKLAVLRGVDRLSCRLARPEFLAVSNYVSQSAQRDLGIPADRIEVLHNSVDPAAFSPSASGPEDQQKHSRIRAELNIPPDAPVVLSVARFDPLKGVKYLLEAVPALTERFPSVVFVFIGGGAPGALERHEEMARRLGIAERVRMLGVQPDVRPYLRLSDVFVLPSLAEGLGLALVEAMAMGLPCVASRVAAIPEVVVDGLSGFLVPPADPQALAQAIARLLDNSSLRRSMGEAGRRIVSERFNIDRNIGALERVYERVARQRRVPGAADLENGRLCV